MPQTLTIVSWPKRYYQGGSRGIYIFTQIVYHFNLKYIFRDSLLLTHIAEVPQHSCCGSPSLQPPPGRRGATHTLESLPSDSLLQSRISVYITIIKSVCSRAEHAGSAPGYPGSYLSIPTTTSNTTSSSASHSRR